MTGFIKKNKLIIERYFINLCVLILYWGNLLRKSYNADSAAHVYSKDADVFINIGDGRYVIALCDHLLLKLGIRTTDNISVTILLTLMFFACSMTILQRIFKEWEPSEVLPKISFNAFVSLVFLNVLFSENLMFSEYCIYYGIAYLAATLGVLLIKKNRLIPALLFFIIGTFTYQFSAIYGAIAAAFLMLLSSDFKWSVKAVISEIKAVMIPMAAGVINIITIKIVGMINIRYAFRKSVQSGGLADRIKDAFASLIDLNRGGYGMFPDLFFPAIFGIIIISITVVLFIRQGRAKDLSFYLVVLIGSFILLYVIPIMNSELNFPPRMAFSFFQIQGLLGAAYYAVSGSAHKEETGNPGVGVETGTQHQTDAPTQRQQGTEQATQSLVLAACFGYMFIHLIFAEFITTNHFVSNTIDKIYAEMVVNEIEKYEERTGIEVKNVCAEKDINSTFAYDEVSYHRDQINEKIMGQATLSYIEVVTGRHFDWCPISQEIWDEHFTGRNWDVFDLSEQLVFDGDTAYWCLY